GGAQLRPPGLAAAASQRAGSTGCRRRRRGGDGSRRSGGLAPGAPPQAPTRQSARSFLAATAPRAINTANISSFFMASQPTGWLASPLVVNPSGLLGPHSSPEL